MHINDNFNDIIRILKEGGTILYPTDTIWGIGCDAFNLKAVHEIFEIKRRPKTKPFILLVSDVKMLKEYINELHPRIETLLQYYERPLTVIYKHNQNLPKFLLAKDSSVAIRVTNDPFCQQIIHDLGKPIVSTSANLSGQDIPSKFDEIDPSIINNVDYVVNYKRHQSQLSNPSVIIAYDEEGEIQFLRS